MTYSIKIQRLVSLGLLLATLLGLAMVSYQIGGADYRGPYAAARVLMEGGNPYDYQQVGQMLLTTTGNIWNNPFYYPPHYLLIHIPLALLPFEVARAAWLLMLAGSLVGGLLLTRQALDLDPRPQLIDSLLMIGFASHALRWEQASPLLFLGVALTVWAVQRRRAWLVAVGIALAAIKPPAMMLFLPAMAWWLWFNYRPAFWTTAGIGAASLTALLMCEPWAIDFGGLDGSAPGRQKMHATWLHFCHFVLGKTDLNEIWLIWWLMMGLSLLYLHGCRLNIAHYVAVSVAAGLLLTPYAYPYDYAPLIFVGLLMLRIGDIVIPDFQDCPPEEYMKPEAVGLRLLATPFVISACVTILGIQHTAQGYWQILAVWTGLILALLGVYIDLPKKGGDSIGYTQEEEEEKHQRHVRLGAGLNETLSNQ